jgi:hypothetical protein
MLNRWLRTTTRVISFITAGLIISACGGGGGSGGGGFLGNEGADQLDAVIAMTATNAAGDTDNQLSRSNPLTIEVTLQRANGDPIASAVVELGATVGTVSPDNSSALTDANGVAVFEVTYDGTEGAGTLTATYTEAAQSVDVSLSIQALAGAPAYLLDLATTDPSGNATQRFSSADPLTVTITLYSVEGVIKTPIANEIIALESSIGTVDPSNGSALTDDSGQATFLIQAQADQGAGLITATYSPSSEEAGTASEIISRSQNIEIQAVSENIGGFGLKLELLDAGGNPATELTPEALLTARVTLSSTSATATVASRIINLSSDIATVLPTNGSSLTDAAGVADFTLEFSNTIGAGTVTASFNNNDISLIETAVVEATSAASENALAITLLDSNGDTSNVLSEGSPLTVRVAITDLEGATQAIDDEVITLTSTLGTIAPGNGSTLTEDGIAEFTLGFDGSVGAGVLTASYATAQGDLQTTANIEAQVREDDLFFLAMTSSSSSLTLSNPVTVTVNLRSGSASGSPVSGEIVSLTSDIADISPSNGSAITDSLGDATFTLQYKNAQGAGTVTASYTSGQGNTFTNNLNITASEGTPIYEIKITDPSSGVIFNESGVDVLVRVRASNIEQQTTALLVTLTSDVGIITPETGTALTTASEFAKFELFGDGTEGAGFLTASFTDVDGNIYEDIISVMMRTNRQGSGGVDPSKITFTSTTPETIALKGAGDDNGRPEQSAVMFRVSDRSGRAVSGETVTFNLSAESGGAALESVTGTADADGNVVAIVNSGVIPTSIRVEARILGSQNAGLGTLSSELAVSSGVPVSSRFNLRVSADQTACGSSFDLCKVLSVSSFDRFGNPAVDGTAVNFATNCGSVTGLNSGEKSSCLLGEDGFGRCSVQWRASDLNPTNPRQCGDGSSIKVMGYALGEEDFIDRNGNAYFDAVNCHLAADPGTCGAPRKRELSLEANGEPFLDANGSATHEMGEFFVDWNNNGVWDAVTTSSDDATARPAPYRQSHSSAGSLETNDDLSAYGRAFYNGTACAQRVEDSAQQTSPYITDPDNGAPIMADVEDCSSELIYVWDSVNPLP